MARYSFTAEQLSMLVDRAIDRFLEYQYKLGYEEPRARKEALRDILDALDAMGNRWSDEDAD